MIIDAHAHPVFAGIPFHPGVHHLSQAYYSRKALEWTLSEFVKEMDRAGIDKAILLTACWKGQSARSGLGARSCCCGSGARGDRSERSGDHLSARDGSSHGGANRHAGHPPYFAGVRRTGGGLDIDRCADSDSDRTGPDRGRRGLADGGCAALPA